MSLSKISTTFFHAFFDWTPKECIPWAKTTRKCMENRRKSATATNRPRRAGKAAATSSLTPSLLR